MVIGLWLSTDVFVQTSLNDIQYSILHKINTILSCYYSIYYIVYTVTPKGTGSPDQGIVHIKGLVDYVILSAGHISSLIDSISISEQRAVGRDGHQTDTHLFSAPSPAAAAAAAAIGCVSSGSHHFLSLISHFLLPCLLTQLLNTSPISNPGHYRPSNAEEEKRRGKGVSRGGRVSIQRKRERKIFTQGSSWRGSEREG